MYVPAARRSRRLVVADSGEEPRSRPFLPYVVGNGGALLLGLVAAYAALAWTGAGDAAVKSIKTVDFMTYYSVFQLILHGHGAAMYDPHVLGRTEAALSLPFKTPYGVIPYLYPSYFALVFSPLGTLPYAAAYTIWLAMNCLLLVGVLWLLEQEARLGRRGSLVLRLSSVCFLPVFMALGLGQSTLLLLAALAGTYCALRSRRDALAGSLLALAIIKPYYVLPILVVLAVQRRWQAIRACAVTAAALLLAPALVLGVQSLTDYVKIIVAASQWAGHAGGLSYQHVPLATAVYAPEWNHSFAGLAQLLLAPNLAAAGGLAFTSLALALLAWCARSRDLGLALGLAVLVALLISPHTLMYDLTLLLLPAASALRYRSVARSSLIPLLVAEYLAITVGYRLVFAAPVQLSAISMAVFAVWYVMVIRWRSRPSCLARENAIVPPVKRAHLQQPSA